MSFHSFWEHIAAYKQLQMKLQDATLYKSSLSSQASIIYYKSWLVHNQYDEEAEGENGKRRGGRMMKTTMKMLKNQGL